MSQSKTETEIGRVNSPGTKISFSIVRDAKGSQQVYVYLIDSDARVRSSLAVLSRQYFGDLKDLVEKVDVELAKAPTICRACKTPIHSDAAFAESRGPCPFCGKMPTRF